MLSPLAKAAQVRYPEQVSRSLVLLLLLLVLAGLSCASVAPQSPDRGPPPAVAAVPLPSAEPGIRDGERLLVTMRSHGFTIGEVELSAGPRCLSRGREVLPVRSHAAQAGLYGLFEQRRDELLSWLDALDGRPLRTRSIDETDKRIADTAVIFGPRSYRYLTRRTYKQPPRRPGPPRRPPSWQDRPLPGGQPAYDVHSALGLLRRGAAELLAGQLHMVLTRSLWRIEVTAATREPVRVGAGSFPQAIRLDGTARRLSTDLKPRKRVQQWSLWISDDSDRLPLKAQLESRQGILELELKSYELHPSATAVGGLERCR